MINLPTGEIILVDLGPINSPVIDWLQQPAQLKRPIAAVILTHNDADHTGALTSLLALPRQNFGIIYMLQDRPKADSKFVSLFRVARELEQQKRLEIKRLEAGSAPIYQNEILDVVLKVVHPSFSENIESASANQTSGIIVLESCKVPVVVWPGDAHLKSINLHLKPAAPEIMVGPHHGAPQNWDGLKSPTVVRNISPKRVYFSLGTKNQHEHPNTSYIRTLKNCGCRVTCSQITTKCDRQANKKNRHILKGNVLLGYPPAKSGNSCRGGMRVTIKGPILIEDSWQNIHLERIRKLSKAKCI